MTALSCAVSPGAAKQPVPSGTENGEWRTYGGDLRSTRYAPLDQIDADNFNKLQIAWRFKADNLGPRPDPNFQATPLMANGVLYFTAGTRRAAVALDARTGELLWKYSIDEGKRGENAPRRGSGRGLAYWTDGRNARVIYVTPGYRMVALDARTGLPVPGFGRGGVVDLKRNIDQDLDPETADLGLHAAPIVVGDVIVVGAAHAAGDTPMKNNVKGYVRGFDVRSGRRLWIFHTIPLKGEFGNDSWESDSWTYTGNTGSWAQMSADPELGLVYVPVELPTADYYGGNRPGKGLFGESIVALDVKTGKRRWHFQTIHHGLWDRDIPAAPVLADIMVDGKRIKALAQPTKQAWLYVLNRETGEPVWPIEERPVPRGDVPGEWYSPTQPYVTKPPAFDRQGITEDDLIDFTPALRSEALNLVSNYRLGPLYTPPALSKWPGPLATLMLPNVNGGANWPGGALDPASNILYIYSFTAASAVGIVPADPARTDIGYMPGQMRDPDAPQDGQNPPLDVRGLPLIKPPYGRVTAIDLNRGDIVWQVAHGETPDEIRNHPALRGLHIPRTGSAFGRIGVLVTKTLVIAGEAAVTTATDGRRGAMLRAYDKATGADAGAVYMPAPQTGSPMTYMLDGRQYLTVSISGWGYSGELLAFRLPF